MFDPGTTPRVFALPPGADFPAILVEGLRARLAGAPPEAMARVELIVNTRRMARRIREIFDAGPPALLPRISLLSDHAPEAMAAEIPPPIPPLRRRLELAQLISRLLEREPDLAPRAALYDLADSLAGLLSEMQGEGVPPETIAALDISDQSGHWDRARRFIALVEPLFAGGPDGLDPEARQRLAAEALARRWAEAPPDHPVIVAGSTGSRGPARLLMQAAAHLPQGAVVLPGFDFDLPAAVWEGMTEALSHEDHPQFRFAQLLHGLALPPDAVRPWHDAPAPGPDRNRILSLALRPAPVTDAWLAEGPALADPEAAMRDVTLLEAPTPRAEALAIALRLREAAERGQRAALISPDRMLTRQVTAALDRWGILPDDSAGMPLHLSPPGRFLRHVAELFARPLGPDLLLTLLNHPLCHGGQDRPEHQLRTRDLELALRGKAMPFPSEADVIALAAAPGNESWAHWVARCCCARQAVGERPLPEWIGELRELAEALSAGSAATGSGPLWDQRAGQEALAVIESLEREAAHGGGMTARDFADLLGALLAAAEVRDRDKPHPDIMIWGTLEARVQGAELVILGGLNEGSWPQAARPDPWLNRALRDRAGLLLPERRVGLSAHDFQQAAGAPEVWLTRAVRSDDAETVASRWLNRITNLLGGLEATGGTAALAAMRRRGHRWLVLAEALEAPDRVDAAHRPAPCPPVAARPRTLSVTQIKTLIRDPYAIYARHVLRLKPLDPLIPEPNALLRGNVLHKLLEDFVKETRHAPETDWPATMTRMTADTLTREVPWATARALWKVRVDAMSGWFLTGEADRRALAPPGKLEAEGALHLGDPDVTLTVRADRIDRTEDGRLLLYDYKSGKPPTPKEQRSFDKQLLAGAAMAAEGAFKDIPAADVARAVFIGLTERREVEAPLDEESPEEVLEGLRKLFAAMLSPEFGFAARRAMQKDSDTGLYDHLARLGEWDLTAHARKERLA